MTARSFCIIIPTYNRAAVLGITLDSVAALQVPDEWAGEVLVIDNRSPDDTAAVVEERRGTFPLALRRIVEDRQGASHARNRGIEEARGDWLIFLDDDVKIAPGWLHAIADAVRDYEPDAVVGPVFPWFEDEAPDWCTGRVLDSVTSAYSRKGDRTQVLPAAQSHELPGCNFAVQRALAVDLGGFHPALDRAGKGMLAGGDFEFGRRITRKGGLVLYVPNCAIEHFISKRKVSKEGLRQRWYFTGKTIKKTRQIHNDTFSIHEKLRLLSRMIRFELRAVLQVRRNPVAAFRWELEALALRGLLVPEILPGRME